MTTFQKFKRAISKMKETGELEKILKAQKSIREKKKVERDIAKINVFCEAGIENVPAIPIIYELESVDIFKNALCYMNDKEEDKSYG